MPTPDFPDWTTPVRETETVTTILASVATIPNGSAVGPFDTSGAQSLAFAASGSNSTLGVRIVLQLTWLEGAFTVLTEWITLHTPASYGINAHQVEGTIPVRGSGVQARMWTSDGNPAELAMWASTRPVPDRRISTDSAENGRLLRSTGNQALAAGATSAVFYVPPVARSISVRIPGVTTGVANTCRVLINGVQNFGGSPGASRMIELAYANGAQTFNPVEVPEVGLEVSLTNGDTVAHTISADIWDVS